MALRWYKMVSLAPLLHSLELSPIVLQATASCGTSFLQRRTSLEGEGAEQCAAGCLYVVCPARSRLQLVCSAATMVT